MISDATKRRLERTYAPTQPVENGQAHNPSTCFANLEKMIPQRPHPSTLGGDGAPQDRQERRSLPTRAVTDDNLDDAYVDFIMYCNPTVALNTDTTELRKIFRAPPKSDGKSFSTFRLFELIGKLEQKEIKTWAQLALDLGVEPPSAEKGQSAQKVQQYSVRLKVSYFRLHPLIGDLFLSAVYDVLATLSKLFFIVLSSISMLKSDSDGCMLCMLTLSSSIF